MQRKTMASRGMAVLGAGAQVTREAHLRDNTIISDGLDSGLWERAGPSNNKKDRQSSHYKYHVDFNSDVPEETAALWVGTPYAAWIEKDVQRRYAKENLTKLKELEHKLDNEVQRREAVETELQETQERLKKIPELEEALTKQKLLLLKQVQKGVAAVQLGNMHAVCRDILFEWRRFTTASIIDRLRRKVPDVGRCQFEMVQLQEEANEHLKAIQLQMLNTVARFMDKDAMIIQREGPEEWP